MFVYRLFRRRPDIRDPLVTDDKRIRHLGPHDMPDTFGLKCRAARMGV